MTDLEAAGYSRALWIPDAQKKWYLRPGGLSVCTEAEALEEIRELVAGDDGEAEER